MEFPDQKVAVGVLCNVSSGAATQYAQTVADLYLGSAIKTDAGSGASVNRYTLKTEEIEAVVGLYRNTETGEPLTLVRDGGQCSVIEGGARCRRNRVRVSPPPTAAGSRSMAIG